ncbi:MAG: prohibitin family protein [Tildeniella nuda ZEHNDER 1965/U140]|jgi:regulator of protease activity HflC (stomatin/prohibitin superfamily)|nr:prohibitin family protein [Tildeniella nuda ZEHNDER 1965/U140]
MSVSTQIDHTVAKAIPNGQQTSRETLIALRLILVLLGLALLSSFFVVVGAGQRGVLMQFGRVQPDVLEEGLHVIVPIVNTVQLLSVRVQSEEISAEASSKDLQDVYTDVALNWHILPAEAPLIFQQVGEEEAIVKRIIDPAVEEVLKAVMALYTAEEIITRRGEVKAEVDRLLEARLINYHLGVDDLSLVHVHFSDRFRDAVEAKQVAEQEAKRAGFMVLKAQREAEVKVNLARGEAEAQRLIRETLDPALVRKQAVERWDGKLPLIVGDDSSKLLELELDEFVKAKQN